MDSKRAIGIVSDATYRAFTVTAIAEPLIRRDRPPGEKSFQRLSALCAGLLAASVLKRAIPERRPDGSDNKSFPSGHSVVTVAVAHMAASQEPERAALWYGGAAVETTLRALSRKHHLRDVIAGSILGYLLVRWAWRGGAVRGAVAPGTARGASERAKGVPQRSVDREPVGI